MMVKGDEKSRTRYPELVRGQDLSGELSRELSDRIPMSPNTQRGLGWVGAVGG